MNINRLVNKWIRDSEVRINNQYLKESLENYIMIGKKPYHHNIYFAAMELRENEAKRGTSNLGLLI